MSTAFSIFVIVLTLANVAGALWLLWWTRRAPGEANTTEHTTGHVWDEDLTELNNPLPRWWLWLFLLTVVFGLVYFVLYPAMGNYPGTLKWTSRTEHAAESQLNAQRIEQALAPFSARSVAELSKDGAALNIGRNLFLNNCATCHGSDGGGAPGFPNLTDKDWLYGGDPDTLVATIGGGRNGIMPPWGEALGARGVEDVLAYVMSLSGRKLEAGDAHAGREKFQQLCAACHGPDAHGNPAMGAPNLTDGTWLHGGSLAAVRETIEKGRTGSMPAHAARLGETRVKLLAAYVLSLGRQQDAPQVVAGVGDDHTSAP
ncbi:MAG TPA: cytochrome-c oxidase, cbb3-type subunit III [Steroidobacteraceae bacterium]|nr:cytochrome-c oxidase, cbb3-type subunit III [Steroidobacteraceae bacterium]